MKTMNEKTDSSNNKKKTNKALRIILMILLFLLIWLLLFFGIGFIWMMNTWSRVSLSQLITQMKTLEGTTVDTISKFIVAVILPTFLVFFLILGLYFFFRRFYKQNDKRRKIATCLVLSISVLGSFSFAIPVLAKTYNYLKIGEYLENSKKESVFIDENYVSPDDVEIIFPEKKRNLILLTLESMEMTYTDKDKGGFFDDDYLEGLSELALENECFSDGTVLNGATALEYTDWTMAALFSYSTGLPFKTILGQNNMDTQETFFPNVISLGDILCLQGYDQTFLCGSDACFAGRKLYFQSHGDYTIHDYYTYFGHGYTKAENQWGYMDYHLFDFAKDELRTKASAYDESSKPFNFTMLTVDTHFYVGDSSHPDGFVCQYCEDKYPVQYANVISCSARQATDFVNWFFGKDGNTDISDNVRDNTTFVILGDHPTMSSTFCDDADKAGFERRTYVNFINSARTRKESTIRKFSHFDVFPTILSSLDVSMSSSHLALGIDLYSGESTYLENNDIDYINMQLLGKSDVIESLLKVNPYEYSYLKRMGRLPTADVSYIEKEDKLTFYIKKLNKHGLDEELDHPTLRLVINDEIHDIEMDSSSHDSYEVTLDKADYFTGEVIAFEATFSIHGVNSNNLYSLGSIKK